MNTRAFKYSVGPNAEPWGTPSPTQRNNAAFFAVQGKMKMCGIERTTGRWVCPALCFKLALFSPLKSSGGTCMKLAFRYKIIFSFCATFFCFHLQRLVRQSWKYLVVPCWTGPSAPGVGSDFWEEKLHSCFSLCSQIPKVLHQTVANTAWKALELMEASGPLPWGS